MEKVSLIERPNIEIVMDEHVVNIKGIDRSNISVTFNQDISINKTFFEAIILEAIASMSDYLGKCQTDVSACTDAVDRNTLNAFHTSEFFNRLHTELNYIMMNYDIKPDDVNPAYAFPTNGSGKIISNMITIEGGDGSGKSTIVEKLIKHLQGKLGLAFYYLREPGGVKTSENIRKVILDPKNEMDSFTEALLFAAARNEMYNQKMFDILDDKENFVICDRSVISSIVMQGISADKDVRFISQINNGYVPEVIIVLDVDAEVGMSRVNDRTKTNDRIDSKGIEYAIKVNSGYREFANRSSRYVPFGTKVIKVDANRPLDEVYKDVENIIFDFILKRTDNLKKIKRVDKKWL